MRRTTFLFPIFSGILCFSITLSCRNESSLFISPVKNIKSDNITSVQLDTIILDPIECSFTGEPGIRNDSIYFVDYKLCSIFFFNTEGKFLTKKLERGRGPRELQAGEIVGYSTLKNGGWLFIGSGNDCYIYDKNFNFQYKFFIDKGRDTVFSYKKPLMYTLYYNNLILKNINGYLYYNVYSEAPGHNYFEQPAEYFKECKIISKMELKTGKVMDMLGKYPTQYHDKAKALRLFDGIYFDMDSHGNFYVTYEADSLIYCYDNNFTVKHSFGFQGRKMKTDYPELALEEFIKNYSVEKQKYGRYLSLTRIDPLDMIIRIYSRNESAQFCGMQIYKDCVLKGDINVPKNFKIIGYRQPYIYAWTGTGETDERIRVLRFEIKSLTDD